MGITSLRRYYTQEEPKPQVDTNSSIKVEDKHICTYCGKELKSAGGRASHERACKENPHKEDK